MDSPFAISNVRRFIAFRIFFNARFYYPVFTILFLDFGLTLSQFALLNVVWAVTIVLCEVPSGALADVMGRRNLLVLAAGLMVLEMLLLCLAPRAIPWLMFAFFMLNRILSGVAEAAASGADEALAYDSLKQQGLETAWGRVLEMQMRLQAMAFIAAMSIGALVYDPVGLQKVLAWFGYGGTLTQDHTLRLPVILTLMMSMGALWMTLGMREIRLIDCAADDCRPTMGQAYGLVLAAGQWIWQTPLALCLILGGVLFDHVIRMQVTLNSQYYRLIKLPEASFGLIGAGLALMGIFMPRLAGWAVDRFALRTIFSIMGSATLLAFTGVMFCMPYWGLAPVVVLVSIMMVNNYVLSRLMNQITASHQRATVLSFKGLSFNLAYGAIGLMYAGAIAVIKGHISPVTAADMAQDPAFQRALYCFPVYFLLFFIGFVIFAYFRLGAEGRRQVVRKPTQPD